MDPRLEEEITVADLQAQFDYLIRARDRLDALDEALARACGRCAATPVSAGRAQPMRTKRFGSAAERAGDWR